MPDEIRYEQETQRLWIGEGYVESVPAAVWTYEVSGMKVLKKWFSYRQKDRSRPLIGGKRPPSDLDRIQPQTWLSEYTTELLNVLHVLGRLLKLEKVQAELLDEVCSGPLITPAQLSQPTPAKKPQTAKDKQAALRAAGQKALQLKEE